MKATKNTVLKCSSYTTALTRSLKGAERLHCRIDEEGKAVFVCNGYEADKYQHTAITFHSSKGLEFDQVVVFAEDYRLSDMPSIYNHYVAVTRAKRKLIIVKLNNYNANCFQINLEKLFNQHQLHIHDLLIYG